MKIYTKTGDKGETSLFGGKKLPKDALRIEAYGTVDELNSFLGLAEVEVKDKSVKKIIRELQNQLFTVGSDLATPLEIKEKNFVIPRVTEEFIINSEKTIDYYSSKTPELKNFILPGGTKGASLLHVARSVCRRAERRVVALIQQEQINRNIIIFLNRISDLLFVLARYENFSSGKKDINWKNPITK